MVVEIHAAIVGGTDDLSRILLAEGGHSHASLNDGRDLLGAVNYINRLHTVILRLNGWQFLFTLYLTKIDFSQFKSKITVKKICGKML